MKAILRKIRISPKKANLIAQLVRTKTVADAVETLKFTNKKAAPIIKKLIESAVANAENNFKQNKDSLYLKEIIVTEGATYKRSIPISRGRMHPLLKRTSHITVKLAVKEEEEEVVEKVEKETEKVEKEKKTEEKTEKKTEEKPTKSKKDKEETN